MNRDLFVYNEETHIGVYNGKPIPSVTQLLDLLYPYSEDIPEERLTKAAERGTKLHNAILKLNEYFDNPFGWKHNIEVVREVATKMAKALDLPQLIDYVIFLETYGLQPFDYEEEIFLLDESDDPICFGHYDCTYLCQKDIAFLKEGLLVLTDYKTTSLFAKQKVALQESIYALAYEQCSKNQISGINSLWFSNEGTKLIPLELRSKENTIALATLLRQQWEEKQKEN